MGQKLSQLRYDTDVVFWNSRWSARQDSTWSFPDLKTLPPEIGLMILSNLDAVELRSVKDFWGDLANNDLLWRRLCYKDWGFCSAYRMPKSERGPDFWKTLFNNLEQTTEFLNNKVDCESDSCLKMLIRRGILEENAEDITEFILSTDLLKSRVIVNILKERSDVVKLYVERHNFTGVFLPVALRSFFFKLSLPMRRQSPFITQLFDHLTFQYAKCNPQFSEVSVQLVVHSLYLLSNDLCNPSIKNKMSKREFIKNTLRALSTAPHPNIDDDYLCHAYDNVYLIGHIAPVRLD